MMGQRFAEELGQPFVIDNRPGAAGTIGAAIVAKAVPDGYTLLFASASHAISASFYKNLPYNSSADFSGVGRMVSGPLVLVAHPSVSANSIKEVIALAKEKLGRMNYASSGAGSITHLATEMFLNMTGIKITHVSYKGASPARIALLGGEVQLLIAPLGPTVEFINAGKLKALGLCGARRSGVPGYEADTWYGVLAPRGTPASILDLLNMKILDALKNDQIVKQLSALGFEPAGTSPKQFDAYVKSEIAKWGRAMKDAGLQQN
jgi:tripartite-type tricarboxylate transporter receptor subunit TctC